MKVLGSKSGAKMINATFACGIYHLFPRLTPPFSHVATYLPRTNLCKSISLSITEVLLTIDGSKHTNRTDDRIDGSKRTNY